MQFRDSVDGVFEEMGARMIPVPVPVGAFPEAEIRPEINYPYVPFVNFLYEFGRRSVRKRGEYHVGIVRDERRIRAAELETGYFSEVRKDLGQRTTRVP